MILKSLQHILFTCILTVGNILYAQQALDTLYANDAMNVALFFPSPIKQAITGSDNFVFTYNREEPTHLGLLQAVPSIESNLLVITLDGHVYGYILKYTEELTQLNYFIQAEKSIGTEHPTEKTFEREDIPKGGTVNYNESYQKICDSLVKTKHPTLVTKRKKGIRLRLENRVYQGQEVYLVLEIQNRSTIDLEMDYLDIAMVNGNHQRKASYQELPLKPTYTYQKPKIIQIGQTKRMVYVLPKFVLGDSEKLMLELIEMNGNRKVFLKTKL